MWTCGFMFSVSVSLTLASEFYSENGWVPVNSDIVYKQIKHGINLQQLTGDDVQVLNADTQSFVSNHRKLKNIDDFNNGEYSLHYDNSKNKRGPPYEFSFLPFKASMNQKVNTDGAVRRSKKLADIDSQVLFNYIVLPKIDKPKNFLKKVDEEKHAENFTHTYKVTEDISTEDEMQEESKDNENGYEYTRPIKQNFTNDLTKYLSKYNINGNDNLQNYALSRQPKAKNRVILDHRHKPFQIQVPARYNSLNHLPVDPLLAVFLSNYGHYLQGQYGISNNYNNLYGYLASNNIHNNRPFGFYKLFSDTDSSNR